MKIEHWQSLKSCPDRQLDYGNLLGACMGGEGQPSALQHCDTRKGAGSLRWNPADPLCGIEQRLGYKDDGRIFGHEQVLDRELNDVLNLNMRRLMRSRRDLWHEVLNWWKREKDRIRGPVPRDRIMRKRDKYLSGDASLRPFCQVAVWWLEQRLARSKT